LGRSPIDFFDISKPQPCFARAGDRIQFRPIDKGTYYQIMGEEQDGNYKHKFHAI